MDARLDAKTVLALHGLIAMYGREEAAAIIGIAETTLANAVTGGKVRGGTRIAIEMRLEKVEERRAELAAKSQEKSPAPSKEEESDGTVPHS